MLINKEELKKRLEIEARRIDLRKEYHKYDTEELQFLIKKNPLRSATGKILL